MRIASYGLGLDGHTSYGRNRRFSVLGPRDGLPA